LQPQIATSAGSNNTRQRFVKYVFIGLLPGFLFFRRPGTVHPHRSLRDSVPSWAVVALPERRFVENERLAVIDDRPR